MNTAYDNISFGPASESDRETVIELYEQVKDSPYTTWSEEYPTIEDIDYDIAHHCLYIFRENGSAVGTLSVVYENELDHLGFWNYRDVAVREIVRVAVAKDRQGRGICRMMVLMIEDELKSRGVGAIRLLAAKKNIPACRAYLRCGYSKVGECHEWGNDYFACEKRLITE